MHVRVVGAVPAAPAHVEAPSGDGNAMPGQVLSAIAVLRGVSPTDGAPFGEREAAALAVIYRAYGGMLLAVARHLVGADDAEDVLHDVFYRLPRIIGQYRDGRFGGWLKQTTARTALMRLRSARSKHLQTPATPAVGDMVTSGDIAALERDDEVRWALAELSEPLREVVVLRIFLDHSHREIADILGISVSASEVRLCRALRHLRLLLRMRGATMRVTGGSDERVSN